MGHRCDKEFADKVVSLYNSGLTQREVGSALGCSETKIFWILKENNVQKRGKAFYAKIFNEKDIDRIVDEYLSGKSIRQLAKENGCSIRPISNALHERNIKIRSLSESNKLYSLNEKYFDVIDTQDKAYILGLLYSDGCNTINYKNCHYRVSITLQVSDRHILEDINKCMESNAKIYSSIKQGNEYATLGFSSKYMSLRLNELGMIPNKSLTLDFPKCINESLLSHFVRGVFDGDGSIDKRCKYASLIGSDKMMNEVSFILKNLGINHKIYGTKNPKTLQISVHRKEDRIKFLNWIYKDAHLKLNRKYERYLKMLELYDAC